MKRLLTSGLVLILAIAGCGKQPPEPETNPYESARMILAVDKEKGVSMYRIPITPNQLNELIQSRKQRFPGLFPVTIAASKNTEMDTVTPLVSMLATNGLQDVTIEFTDMNFEELGRSHIPKMSLIGIY